MFAGNESNARRRLLAAGSTGALSLIAGITSAAALMGAAFLTVENSGCTDPGQYIRHDSHVELVGGCVDGSELPRDAHPNHRHGVGADPATGNGNYRR